MSRRIKACQTWLFASIICATILGVATVSEAFVFFNFNSSGVSCGVCDTPFFQDAASSLGQPVAALNGAKWVQSPNGTTYAGGLRNGQTAHFHLDLRDYNTGVGTTHFLLIFTTVVTGGNPGALHIRDTSPGAKGEIKMVALPARYTGTDTGLIERVYRTPGADFTLTPTGAGSDGTSSDPLPWDHAINNPVIDFALTMSGLGAKATWGIATVIGGAHRMPCHCDPGAPQAVPAGCSTYAPDDNSCCVPLNATDTEFSLPRLYCPTVFDPAISNACGQPQARAWTCPAVQDVVFECTGPCVGGVGGTCDAGQFCNSGIQCPAGICTLSRDVTYPLDFACSAAGAPGTTGTHTCTNPEIPGITDASSCTYSAKICK